MAVVGDKTTTGWTLIKRIESLNEFWEVINSTPSIFWRFKMMPSAFLMGWHIRDVNSSIKAGHFFIAERDKIRKKRPVKPLEDHIQSTDNGQFGSFRVDGNLVKYSWYGDRVSCHWDESNSVELSSVYGMSLESCRNKLQARYRRVLRTMNEIKKQKQVKEEMK